MSTLSQSELDAVRDATRAAELRSGGELVCVLVERCDPYEGAPWKGAALGALAGTAAAALWQALSSIWGMGSLYWILTLGGALTGFVLTGASPRLKRLLVPDEVLDRRVGRRAAQAFLDEEVFDTRDRTGVLILVASFEHRVRIVADSGIARHVTQETWDSIASALARGIRGARAGAALVEAIEACGDVLEQRGVERRDDDENELSDEPRLRSE